MPEVTTAIHEYGSDRMTPYRTIASLKKDIVSNEICMEKYAKYFKMYKMAKLIRKQRYFRQYSCLLRKEFSSENLKKMVALLWK